MKSRQRWVGLFQVKPQQGVQILGSDERGAFVTGLGLETSAARFRSQVARALDAMGLDLIAAEEIETYERRIAAFEVPDAFPQLANSLGEDNPLEFCSSHTYP